jgi:hypothetical protein
MNNLLLDTGFLPLRFEKHLLHRCICTRIHPYGSKADTYRFIFSGDSRLLLEKTA